MSILTIPDRVIVRAAKPAMIPAIGEDGRLHPIEKLEAHRRGIKHLAISVFVFSGDRLLIQQRAAEKYHSGLLWANTVCSHPHWGETPEASAHRRLREELGLNLFLYPGSIVEYRAAVSEGLIEHERVHVFRGDADAATLQCSLDPAEVAAVRWITLADLQDEIARKPQTFAPWLRIYVSRWRELGLARDCAANAIA